MGTEQYNRVPFGNSFLSSIEKRGLAEVRWFSAASAPNRTFRSLVSLKQMPDFEIVSHTYPATARHDWTVWFTGLSGSGKSTLANRLAEYLDLRTCPYELIDGDAVREQLCQGLGFSKEDRDENIRRIGYVAGLLNRHNIVSIVAAISPYRQARADVRNRLPKFLEIHVDCPLETLVRRDVKGLYKRALAGQIEHFSGISDPYEAPVDPDVYVNSGTQTPEESLALIVGKLEKLGWMSASSLQRPSLTAV